MASSPSLPKTLAHLRAAIPTYLSHTNAHIAHIDRLLSRTSTLDKTLLTASYTLHLLHAILSKLPKRSTILSRRLTTSLPPLTALFDDIRVFLRLWGLLGIYSWARSTYLTPPSSASAGKDRIVKILTWGQVVACAIYQGLENGAYLAGKGVVGWKKETVARAWLWSGRAWCVYVGLELARLGMEWSELKGLGDDRIRRKEEKAQEFEQKEKEEEEGEVIEKGELELRMDKVEDEGLKERWTNWYREVGVNMAYAPMTVHYSLQDGILGEGVIGALGSVVAALSIGQAWKETA